MGHKEHEAMMVEHERHASASLAFGTNYKRVRHLRRFGTIVTIPSDHVDVNRDAVRQRQICGSVPMGVERSFE